MSRLVDLVRKLIAWGQSLVRDPQSGDASSARIIALMFAVTACLVALLTAWKQHEAAATVAALSGGGVGGILGRTRPPGSNS